MTSHAVVRVHTKHSRQADVRFIDHADKEILRILSDKYLLFDDIICSFDLQAVDRLFHGVLLAATLLGHFKL